MATVALIRRYLAGIATALLALGAALLYLKGRKDAADDIEVETFNEYIATRKRIDEIDGFDDADAVSEWLRDRAKRGGGL